MEPKNHLEPVPETEFTPMSIEQVIRTLEGCAETAQLMCDAAGEYGSGDLRAQQPPAQLYLTGMADGANEAYKHAARILRAELLGER